MVRQYPTTSKLAAGSVQVVSRALNQHAKRMNQFVGDVRYLATATQ